MANIKQQIADTHEYSKLISETLITEAELLQNLDHNTNQLGQTAIQMTKVSNDLASDLKEQGDLLKESVEAQVKNADELAVIDGKVNDLNVSIEKSAESFDLVADAVVMVSDKQEHDKEVLLKAINGNTENYTKGVTVLNDAMLEIVNAVTEFDYNENFNQLEKQVSETNEQLIKVNEDNNNQTNQLINRLESLASELGTMTEQLSELNTKNEEIQNDVKTAIARTTSLETKMESLSASAPENKVNFADELEALKAVVNK